jgi:PIN domain nuclease of toxin-antitoxin system
VSRLLLDTHLVLWWLSGDARLPQSVVERVQASLWEMAIKVSIHRDPFDHLLVCQSRVEPMLLLTVNSQLKRYGATVHVLGLGGLGGRP